MTPDLALVKPDDFEPVRACCSRKGDVLEWNAERMNQIVRQKDSVIERKRTHCLAHLENAREVDANSVESCGRESKVRSQQGTSLDRYRGTHFVLEICGWTWPKRL